MEPLLQALSAADACLTLDELEAATGLAYRQMCRLLRATLLAGWVKRADEGCYCLTPEGRDALANGTPLPPELVPATRHAARADTMMARLWTAMRTAERFCRADLIQLAAKDEDDARRLDGAARIYMSRLRSAGYLVRLQGTVRVNPTTRGQTRWRLAWDTGPLPPRPQHGAGQRVFDPNRSRVYSPDALVGPA